MMTWVSAGEGNRFAEVVTRLTERIIKLGPQKQLRRI
jgi:coenzyme F420-reducing hydrogenase delta subunit